MKHHSFVSGTYTGFFNYRAGGEHYPMTLTLRFSGGKVAGTGEDQHGQFIVLGTYDSLAGESHWTKTYGPDHLVAYRVFSDLDGLWGTWEIAGVRAGGFQVARTRATSKEPRPLLPDVRRTLGR